MTHVNSLKLATCLFDEYLALEQDLRQLNNINMGDALSLPTGCLQYVDKKALAKGLLSLVIERQVEIKKELVALGIDGL